MAAPDSIDRKEPLVAGVLSFCVPGLGHLYAGSRPWAAGFFLVEAGLLITGRWLLLLPLHAFGVVAAAGSARTWNERHADALGRPVLPPPPPKALSDPALDETLRQTEREANGSASS